MNDGETGLAGRVTEGLKEGDSKGYEGVVLVREVENHEGVEAGMVRDTSHGEDPAVDLDGEGGKPKNDVHEEDDGDQLVGEVEGPENTIHGEEPALELESKVSAPKNDIHDDDNDNELVGEVERPDNIIHGDDLDLNGKVVPPKNVEHSDMSELEGDVKSPQNVKHGDDGVELAGEVEEPVYWIHDYEFWGYPDGES